MECVFGGRKAKKALPGAALNFMAEGRNTSEELWLLSKETEGDGWVVDRRVDQVDYHVKDTPVVFRARSWLPVPPREVLELICGTSRVREFCTSITEAKEIERYDDRHSVHYTRMDIGASKYLPMVAQRDFVYLENIQEQSDGSTVVSRKSVERADVPVRAGVVRGTMGVSGWIVEPVEREDSASYVTYIIQMQAQGWIPSMLLHVTTAEDAAPVRLLKTHFAKQKKGSSRDVRTAGGS